MAIPFTDSQQKVLNARGHNVLVSAAAGSGKTAVLVERIVRMVSEGEHPLDIDRLLIVTFTRAAAAQMRERVGRAISERLTLHPEDRHLQRQETLLHRAQITTIDSFCTFLLRGNCSEIDLDPGFRQMDETEAQLLNSDVLRRFLEEQYGQAQESFVACVEYFCPGGNDDALEDLITELCRAADSHPYPDAWLAARRRDYAVETAAELQRCGWYQDLIRERLTSARELRRLYDVMMDLVRQPDGPYPYHDLLEQEGAQLFGWLDRIPAPLRGNLCGAADPAGAAAETEDACADDPDSPDRDPQSPEQVRQQLVRMSQYDFKRLPAIRKSDTDPVDPDRKKRVQDLRNEIKERVKALGDGIDEEPQLTVRRMQQAAGPVNGLIDLVLGYRQALAAVKKERNVIDFSDLEHLALQVLIERADDGTLTLRPAAQAYRAYYDEVLIDEYQDSNEVQELLLSAITGEELGHYARFMVGDVKQSIYRFRNARPEIFQRKFDTYAFDDPQTERIDLDQNFRSRTEVLDAANGICEKIMRREIGGVEYEETVSLKPGASYPDPVPDAEGKDPYQTELLIVDCLIPEADAGEEKKTKRSAQRASSAGSSGSGEGPSEPGADGGGSEDPGDEIAALSAGRKEALAVAQRIHRLVGVLPVTDAETKEQRPARYGDIVILLRSASGRQDAYREIFEKEGIPLCLEYKGGYFSAEEVREVLQMLRVIDNPRQDIPLYGAMRGFFGGFTPDEIGQIRALKRQKDDLLYDCLLTAAETNPRCAAFLAFLQDYRARSATTPIHELIGQLIRQTGYEDYVRALPAGQRRAANLHSLLVKAQAFEQTDYAGLFRFLRYIDQMHAFDVDYGEASAVDEHADVVRLTTIHKSKGLEYPICIVSGLGSRHTYTRDLSGALLIDADLGLGVNYVDAQLRCAVPTLRQKAVAARIERDALGEELRVLYVAMTRAKEKLILTGALRDAAKKMDGIAAAMEAAELPARHLPASMILSRDGFLPLILKALYALKAEGREPVRVSTVPVTDLQLTQLEDQMTLGALQGALDAVEGREPAALPRPDLAQALEQRFTFRYPHEELAGLYTKTTVTELKRAALLEDGTFGEPGAAPRELYAERDYIHFDVPEETERPDSAAGTADTASGGAAAGSSQEEVLPVPHFAQDAPEDSAAAVRLTGAARGTAVHRLCELIDYREWPDPGAVTARQWEERVGRLLGAGEIPRSYESAAKARTFLPFLHSNVAARMAAADARGLLRREQPFVLGVPAGRLNAAFPPEETILIQGIMDAFFLEEDAQGGGRHVVLVDYKTDRVRTAQELIDRYRVQMDYYSQALEKMLRLPVTERILYSFALQEEIRI